MTSSSLGPSGPHVLTVWDLPTQEERSSEKQFLPAMTCREETPTRQVRQCLKVDKVQPIKFVGQSSLVCISPAVSRTQ